MSFSEKLKKLRTEHNMTQKMLAERLNLARTTITGYETKNRQPSHEKLTAIADIFDVTVDYLIDDREEGSSSHTSADSKCKNSIDMQLMKVCHGLSLTSQKDVLRYAQLLELWEKQKK
jgi:transcriptional regulator with XRE-family HTH domain